MNLVLGQGELGENSNLNSILQLRSQSMLERALERNDAHIEESQKELFTGPVI